MREFYQKVVKAVSLHTEIEEQRILHDRHEMCTDARYLLVHFLSTQLKCNEIVYLTGLSKQAISQITNQYKMRVKFKHSMRVYHRLVEKELEKEDEKEENEKLS